MIRPDEQNLLFNSMLQQFAGQLPVPGGKNFLSTM
jgi:hypothetical protein